jgi:hypothetical protein
MCSQRRDGADPASCGEVLGTLGLIFGAIGLVIGGVILYAIIEHAVWSGVKRALRDHEEWRQAGPDQR